MLLSADITSVLVMLLSALGSETTGVTSELGFDGVSESGTEGWDVMVLARENLLRSFSAGEMVSFSN
jgi:hypothetical protein